jgi:hypothetical protein
MPQTPRWLSAILTEAARPVPRPPFERQTRAPLAYRLSHDAPAPKRA